jgi:hypothetical protein
MTKCRDYEGYPISIPVLQDRDTDGTISQKNNIMWERFFNWQSDLDWTWGPFLPLRPARDEPIRPWVWGRLFLALSGVGSALIGLGGMICVLGPRLAARQHWATPPGVSETLATLAAMGSDHNSQALGIGVVLSLPLLFFLFCWPFHAAWNRRAARLSRLPPSDAPEAPPNVWPPAPNTRDF